MWSRCTGRRCLSLGDPRAFVSRSGPGFPGGDSGKEPACRCGRRQRQVFDPWWVGKVPRRRAQQPAPVFLPGAPRGQRSLAGHSPCVPHFLAGAGAWGWWPLPDSLHLQILLPGPVGWSGGLSANKIPIKVELSGAPNPGHLLPCQGAPGLSLWQESLPKQPE